MADTYQAELDAILASETMTQDEESHKYSLMTDEHETITISEKKVNIGDIGKILKGESNSTMLTFSINRFYDGVDLYGKSISIICERLGLLKKDTFTEDVTNIEYSSSTLKFSWVLSENVTYKAGIVSSAIQFTGTDETGKIYALKTSPFALVVEDTLEGTDMDITVSDDWFTSIESRLNTLENASGLGDSQIITDYTQLTNLPTINGVKVTSAKSLDDYGIAAKNHTHAYTTENQATTIAEKVVDEKLVGYVYVEENDEEEEEPVDLDAAVATSVNAYLPKSEIAKEVSMMEQSLNYKKSVNLFNPSTIEDGQLASGGGITTQDKYSTSDYIDVSDGVGKTIYFTYASSADVDVKTRPETAIESYAFYDKDKNLLSVGIGKWVKTVAVPEGAIYMRFTAQTDRMTNYFYMAQYEKTNYEAYYDPYYEPVDEIAQNACNTLLSAMPVLPPTYYQVGGTAPRLYLQNLLYTDAKNTTFTRRGWGIMKDRYIEMSNPTAGSSYWTEFTAKNRNSEQSVCSTNKITVISALADAHADEEIKVLAIGDSTTAHGYIMAELINLCEKDGITLTSLGTISKSVKDADDNTRAFVIEGRSGWATYDYLATESFNGNTNAFLNNGAFDFSNYMTANSVDTPDWVFIQLGINDTWRPMNNTNTLDNIKTMIDSIHAYNADIKIGVALVLPPYLGEGTTQSALIDHVLRLNINKSLIDGLTDIDNVYLVPINCYLDTIYGFTLSDVSIGGRISATIKTASDVTHPCAEGYHQIADAYHAFIKCN